jgi:hypothetical protein
LQGLIKLALFARRANEEVGAAEGFGEPPPLGRQVHPLPQRRLIAVQLPQF